MLRHKKDRHRMGRHKLRKINKPHSILISQNSEEDTVKHSDFPKNDPVEPISKKMKELNHDNESPANRFVITSVRTRLNNARSLTDPPATEKSLIFSCEENVDENSLARDPNEYLKELTAHALNGMTSSDFRDRMLSSLRTYKAMSTLDAGTRPVFQPYLRRNLLYQMAFADRAVPSFTFGEDEPPLVWPSKLTRSPVRRTPRERKERLCDLVEALISRNSIEENIREFEDIRNFHFSIGTLAAFKRTRDRRVLYRNVAYRRFLKANGIFHPVEESIEKSLDNGCIGSPAQSACISQDSATLSFRMVCHHLLEGERLAKVQVYTVRQRGDVFEQPERLPSATFTVNVNVPMSPVSIDVPTIPSDPQLRVYIVVRVDVTNNLKGIRVDGHALRHLPSRIMRSDTANQDHPVIFEHTLLGTKAIYRNKAPWNGDGGFIVGENNVVLIEQEKLTNDISSPMIVSELEYWSKRLHTNPFLQMRVICGPIYEDDSDCSFSEQSSRSSDGVEGDDELSASSAFRPLKSMGRTHLAIVQNWLRLEIPPLITYRISSGMVPRDDSDKATNLFGIEPTSRVSNYENLTEVQKMGWLTVMDQYETEKCIICGRSFHNMYTLMLHYHLSYPRLTFQLNFRIDPQDENWHRLHIDVFLNPNFDDVNEIITDGRGDWIRIGDPMYIWTRDQAKELKSKLRMDLTIFCDSLKPVEHVLDDPVEECRFIHPESGRWLYRSERLPRYARHLPAPGHEVLIHNTTRRLLDFVDLSDGSKWFMISWNTMLITMGKARCDEAGPYWLNRLFLELHMDTLVRFKQRSHFIYQLNTQTQRGRPISDLEDLVLRLYHARRDYDPLLDDLHPLRDWIFSELKRGYERYRSDLDKPHKDSSGTRRSFPKMYRTDPETVSSEQLHRLFMEVLEAGVVVPFNHPFRKYLLNVVEVLFEGKMPPCISRLRDQDDFLKCLVR
uniref:VEFS-Box domain-containing protein n=1 Tax=Haemonchus contortus TaxID=6289 RepID=A0A7I4YIN9_HAECO